MIQLYINTYRYVNVHTAWKGYRIDITFFSSAHRYRKIFSFDEVMANRNVMVGWLSGAEAVYMETLPENVVMETCTQLIRQFLRDPAIPAPVRMTRYMFYRQSEVCSNSTLPRARFARDEKLAVSL